MGLTERIRRVGGFLRRDRKPPDEPPRHPPAVAEREQPDLAPDTPRLTVLFCDLVGSTKMGSELDVEDYWELIHRYHERCGSEVGSAGGRVVQMIGDGLLCAFGGDRQDDGAKAAVRAALGILRVIAALNESGASRRISVRIGIHTDITPYASEEPSEGTDITMRKTNALVQDLQSLASPGSIVVTEPTHRRLGGAFPTERLGDFTFEKLSRRIVAHRVLVDAGASGTGS